MLELFLIGTAVSCPIVAHLSKRYYINNIKLLANVLVSCNKDQYKTNYGMVFTSYGQIPIMYTNKYTQWTLKQIDMNKEYQISDYSGEIGQLDNVYKSDDLAADNINNLLNLIKLHTIYKYYGMCIMLLILTILYKYHSIYHIS